MGRRTPLTDVLLQRIRRDGPLTFAAFMEACLYHPEYGYYSQGRSAHGAGDYFTSPDVGPLFARLLARQFREMWEALGRPRTFDLVECGAGRGRLAAQLLAAVVEQGSDFAAALRVTLVEASPQLRVEAEKSVGNSARVLGEFPSAPIVGCIVSNELLDALPVHRVVQRPAGLQEIYVSAEGDELREVEGPLSSPALVQYLEKYGAPLQEDQFAEVSLAALEWLERAAASLERGFLMTIDYGYRARELYGPGHLRGTLLAYREHRAEENWLAAAGEQDLTAHVNFTALEGRGRELGLEPLGFTTQSNFLLSLARASGMEEMDAATRRQLVQLVHPEGMGEAFKVLIQAKGVPSAQLTGLQPL
ncbi:MAG TPA: SAM-dependent methyltransferase [Candidatus Acidoferrales bacterium]|nr:SAM-dependent methyltransferase [Candidatus Acidoferrales bacterium]